jgi:hypothetical protein
MRPYTRSTVHSWQRIVEHTRTQARRGGVSLVSSTKDTANRGPAFHFPMKLPQRENGPTHSNAPWRSMRRTKHMEFEI